MCIQIYIHIIVFIVLQCMHNDSLNRVDVQKGGLVYVQVSIISVKAH